METQTNPEQENGLASRAVTESRVTPKNLDVGNALMLDVWHATRPSAASVLGVGRNTIYSMVREGRLPVVRITDHKVMVPTGALLAWIEAQTTVGVEEA